MPYVSVIVPVYNAEKYIERCLRSISNQSFQDIEVLVINDGSSDRSLDVAKEYAKSDLRIKIFSQDNQGVSAARNLGIEKASGEYICFVDADDYIESTMIQKLLQASDTKVLGICNYVLNDFSNKILCNMPRTSYLKTGTALYEDFLVGELGKQIAFSSWNKIFSLQVIRDNGIRFPKDVAIGEDMIFVLRYLCHIEQIRCVDEGLYHYRIHPGSTMNAALRDYLGDYNKTLQVLSELAEKGHKIEKSILAAWSLSIWPIILTNQYVEGMTYAVFKSYYALLRKSFLVQYTTDCKKTRGLKQTALCIAIKTKSALALFCLIKLNRWLHNLHS